VGYVPRGNTAKNKKASASTSSKPCSDACYSTPKLLKMVSPRACDMPSSARLDDICFWAHNQCASTTRGSLASPNCSLQLDLFTMCSGSESPAIVLDKLAIAARRHWLRCIPSASACAPYKCISVLNSIGYLWSCFG
jgi:hypothetical protein